MLRMALIVGGLLGIAACSAAPATTGTSNKKQPTGGLGGFDTSGDGKDNSKVVTPDCTAAAKLAYVLSMENDLYAFAPDKVQFTKIGRVSCGDSGFPNSMAIDRQGFAWVNWSTGDLFKVSTADATCTKTEYEAGQGGFSTFGMAFATNGANTTEETLYVSGLTIEAGGGKGLGKIDLKTMKLTTLGDYSGTLLGEGAELTGTGDGRLFGFFTTAPYATLAEIDKSKGATSQNKSLEGVSTGVAWAFSFWGGDFWFYTSDGEASSVTQLKSSGAGELTVATKDVGGFRIVGAGVSTCAPTEPPR